MSDVAGLMVLEKRQNQFLGGQTQKDFSDEMAKNLDEHIKTILNERYKVVLKSLEEHRDAIEEMTAELLDIEVISGERVRELIKAHGGKVFEDEDLHSESLKDEEAEESNETETTKENDNSSENTNSDIESEIVQNEEKNIEDKKEEKE